MSSVHELTDNSCVQGTSTNLFFSTTSTSTTDGAAIATNSVPESSLTLLTSQPTTTSFPASVSPTAISVSSINTSHRSGLTTGAKAGIAVGAIVGSLAILALLFLCFRFCFARRRNDDSDFKMVSSGTAPGSSGPPGGPAPHYTGYDGPLSTHPMNEMRDVPPVSPPYTEGPNYAGFVGGAYGREPGRNNTISRKPVGAVRHSVQERTSEEGSRPVSVMSEERPRSVAISDIDE